MQEPMAAPREQLPPLVKAYVSIWIVVICLGMISTIQWFIAVMGLLAGDGSMTADHGFQALFFTVGTCLILIRARFTTRLERKRQAAAWGDQRLLAAGQPTPTTETLTLPFTMPMRPRWGRLVAVSVSMLLYGWSIFFVFASHSAIIFAEQLWPLTASLVLFFPTLLFIMFYSAARQQVTLTEHGIMQMGIFPRIKSIPWSQVRLFAVIPVPFSRKSCHQPPVYFEVASADEVIQWPWARSSGVFHVLFFARPAVSPADYEQQMRAVLAVIQARTHLPLYDLRKPL